MLTDRGWAAAGGALSFAVLWVALGEIELAAAAGLLVTGLAAATLLIRLTRSATQVDRRLMPTLVHEGDRAAVDLDIRNLGRRAVHQLTVSDSVGGLGTAEFAIGRLGRGETAVASYQIVCRPRGVFIVGPAKARVSDPLGLAHHVSTAGPADRLIVYPEVEDLSGFPVVRGRDPAMQASRPEFSSRGGEDFYTLRDYQFGDELRRVHWPSSAKHDTLMIRQLETPWQSRALVILDIRSASYESPACFEKAVKGAASVVRHLTESGFDADLWAGGQGTIDAGRYASAMEALALVKDAQNIDIRAVATRLRRTGQGGALILVTGLPDLDLLSVRQLLAREYGATFVLSAAHSDSTGAASLVHSGAIVIRVPPEGSWAQGWQLGVGRSWASAG
jgi:uncharacterized protein (DUF58 family)